ncbi:DUF3369 domain-containing protein [Microbaculum marinum]|uniref:histidine kinase n=1 Tax=Microbaculum marinum TaxID=1764581 RepID=A0AAW9RL83_9HYPH
MSDDDDELVIVLEDGPDSDDPVISGYWKVVVIDDDPAVHDGTRFALSDYVLQGYGLEIISAYSAREGRKVLAEHPDCAVVLLDVVMETDTAGLDLVGYIRNQLKNDTVRIILRTGQPGQAPERSVIVDYDINDYKAKTELTADKLFTTLTSALRSYEQLRRMNETQRGLETIIDAASVLFDFHAVDRLAEAMLGGIASLVGGPGDGVVVRRTGEDAACTTLIGAGRYAAAPALGADCKLEADFRERIEAAFAANRTVVHGSAAAVYLATRSGGELVIAVDAGRPLTEIDQSLIDVFSSRLAVAFDNVALYEELEEGHARLEERVAQRTEELDRANAFKKEVLSIVAHDLKNPLSVILGRADLLGQQIRRNPIPVENVTKHVDQITHSARRMTAMIEGLITEAMNDAVDFTIRRTPCNLAELIRTVVESNQPLADRKAQTISVTVPPTLSIRADYDRIREAVDNLMSNAVKYTPSGGVIDISADVENSEAVIRVADNGPGLSEEDMTRLFGRFQRLSARPTGGESSSGLGLSIVKRVVDLHNGRIWAERCTPDGGTCFTIALPIDR